MAKRSKRKLWIGGAIIAIAIAAISFGVAQLARSSVDTPTALVGRGVFTKYLELRGSMSALRSITLRVPRDAGGNVRILTLAPSGSMVKPGDMVIRFDATQLEQTLQTDQVTLKQAEAAIGQARAAGQLKEQTDVTNLMKARFAVEQAKLEASKQAIISKIEGEEDQLAVTDAEQAELQAEQQLKSDRADDAASIEGKIGPRDKAAADVQRTEQQIAALTLTAPIAGVITIFPNPPWNDNAPHFHPGDQVGPGQQIAEIPDLSTLRVVARVEEVDRGQLSLGQPVTVRVDAVPDRVFTGKITEISTLAKIDFSSGWPPARNFETTVLLAQTDPRLRPGMSASLRIAVSKVPDSTLIPQAAAFQLNGQTVAYVFEGGKFRTQPVEVTRPSDGELAVLSGLKPGERVALKAPNQRK